VAGFSLGIALAGAPGPVQAVLLAESTRGGIARGFSALAGASLTFSALLVGLALGLSIATPGAVTLRILQIVGGTFLVWLAVDAFRSGHEVAEASAPRRGLSPIARGSLAILLNPGAWLFLGAVASPLFTEAGRSGGRAGALLAAVALIAGLAIGDGAIVLLGGIALRRARRSVIVWTGRVLAAALAAIGVWLLVQGVTQW
jgi:threonine/homoserine/homoserine lactone efflux protein